MSEIHISEISPKKMTRIFMHLHTKDMTLFIDDEIINQFEKELCIEKNQEKINDYIKYKTTLHDLMMRKEFINKCPLIRPTIERRHNINLKIEINNLEKELSRIYNKYNLQETK